MNFKEENIVQYYKWTEKYNSAKLFMSSRNSNKVLIECAAQHPLDNGLYPGEEFKKRLDTTINLYNQLTEQGYNVYIYVPGSRHKIGDIADKISLSYAGKKYLIENKIEPNKIYSVNANFKYMGYKGVYNSADECYVASQIFKQDNFSKLISVVSPAQMYRKTLFYIENGVLPLNYSAPTMNMFHNYINEMFGAIPFVLLEDNSWQDNLSNAAINSRNDRCPYLKNAIKEVSDMCLDNFNENYKIDEEELKDEEELNKEDDDKDYPTYNDGSSIY